MAEYEPLLKNIAINNEQEDIYRLIEIFLDYTDIYINPFLDSGIPEDDLRQECALVITEEFSDGVFLEKNDRRERLITGEDEVAQEVFKEIIHDISTSCEKALTIMAESEQRSKMAGKEILAKVNLINEGAERFLSEYGIMATPAELSDYMDISEDIIIEAVELSGYEIKNIDFDTPVRNNKG